VFLPRMPLSAGQNRPLRLVPLSYRWDAQKTQWTQAGGAELKTRQNI
jgi:hypothetical protein